MGLIDKIKGLFHSSKKVWSEEEIFSVLNALRGETQDLMMTASVTDLEAKEYFAAKAKVLTEKINNAIEESSIARDTFKDIYEDVEKDDDYRDEVNKSLTNYFINGNTKELNPIIDLLKLPVYNTTEKIYYFE